MPAYDPRHRRHFPLDEMDADFVDRLVANPDVRERIARYWPLVDPEDYSEWVKFEGKRVKFELASALIQLCGFKPEA